MSKPEQIAHETPVNGLLVRRWAGAWIDFLVLFALVTVVAIALDGQDGGIVLSVDALIFVLYFIGMECAVGGTVGKFVTGLRVVGEDGKNPSFGAALLRTVCRIVEVNPALLGGLPAGLVVNYSKSKQRLGDMMAHTFVLKRADLSPKSSSAA